MTIQNSADAGSYVATNFIAAQGEFSPQGFEFSACIIRIGLRGSFLSTLLNGAVEEVTFWAPEGKERYKYLLNCIRLLTGNEKAYWFSASEAHGQPCKILSIRTARVDDGQFDCEEWLQHFELASGAGSDRSESSYLGLLGERCHWLLLHTYYVDEDFSISIHGSAQFCTDLTKVLRVQECTQPG